MSRVITNNGNRIGYDLAGAGEATPIVFLHGVGSDKSAWAPQLAHFGEERRAVAFDYPATATATPRPRAPRVTIMLGRSSRPCTSLASTARTSADCRSAAWWRSPWRTTRPSAA